MFPSIDFLGDSENLTSSVDMLNDDSSLGQILVEPFFGFTERFVLGFLDGGRAV